MYKIKKQKIKIPFDVDRLGTEATIVDVIRQEIEMRGYGKKQSNLLKKRRDYLMYLYRNFKLVPKDTPYIVLSCGKEDES